MKNPRNTGQRYARKSIPPDELIRRYSAGESTNAIAKHFGVHSTTILSHLRRNGCQPRHQGEYQRFNPRENAEPPRGRRLASGGAEEKKVSND